jgi:hypothetical protein
MKIITKEILIDYLGGSSMGEEGQPDPIEMLLDLLNPADDDCCVEGHRRCILEWTREEDPADKDDRHYHEEQDHIAMEKAKETK